MIEMTAAEVAAVVGGRVVDSSPDVVVTGAAADSNAVRPGDLFVAVTGARFDGHDFAEAALAAGAVLVLACRPLAAADGAAIPCVVVDDPVAALGRLATTMRARLGATVVAITGSSGKTSTKDLCAVVLAEAGPTVAAEGSFNTEVGLPLTILRADDTTAFLVLEMGMRGTGHIEYLCEIARPDVGVVLNVGTAHIGVVGSRAAIAEAKAELVSGVREGGVVVLNADDPTVRAMAPRTAARVVLVGEAADADVRAAGVMLDDRACPSFTLEDRRAAADGPRAEVALRLSGGHHVGNALAAAAVGLSAGLDVADVARALNSAEPVSRWRMEVREAPSGITVINDAFNANPESMRAALKALVAMAGGRRTWAVLGEMRELGDTAVDEHDAIGRLAVRLDVSRLVCVGEGTRVMHLGAAGEGSWADESVHVPDIDAAIALLHAETKPGDVVLVKASRSVGLERVADDLLAWRPA